MGNDIQASAKHGLLILSRFVYFLFFVFCFLFQCSNRQWFQCRKSKTNGLRVTKFGTGVDLHDVWANLEFQGHRSKVRVRRSKNVFPRYSVWAYLFEYQIEPCMSSQDTQNHIHFVRITAQHTLDIAHQGTQWVQKSLLTLKMAGYVTNYQDNNSNNDAFQSPQVSRNYCTS